MKKLVRTLALLLLTAVATLAHGDILKGKVIGVVDGDTITIMAPDGSQRQVRLSGIDAPEKDQASGAEARSFLTSLVMGRTVRLEPLGPDPYGRTVAKVTLNARDVGLEVVKAGFAWHYRNYEGEQSDEDRRLYTAAEAEARQATKGLWGDPAPLPPWEFREREKQSESATGNTAASLPFPRGAVIIKGSVQAVTSGDTLMLAGRGFLMSVCLRHVAVPYPGQPYADAAKQHLELLALGRNVAVAVSREDEEEGCYAGEVFRDGLNVGLQMVRDGVAWYDQLDAAPDADARRLFEQSELAARGERRGLWLDAAPTPPWVYREREATKFGNSGGGGYGYGGSPTGTGKDVRVRGYTRRDGTYVRPHTRSAPGRGAGGRGGRGRH